MNHTYKIGDTVVITRKGHGIHCFNPGQTCTIRKVFAHGNYLLRSVGDIEQIVCPSDFRPAEASYSLQEYRDRLPTNSEGWEGGHTEQGI